jgi:streptogramin lyase
VNHQRLRRLLVATALSALAAAAPAAADVTPEFFTIPDGRGASPGIATAPDGTVWFGSDRTQAEQAANAAPPLARLTPAAASPGTADGIDVFATPKLEAPGECCSNFIRAVAYDGVRGRIWFVRSTGVFGYGSVLNMTPGTSGGFTSGRQDPGMDLGGVALAADGTAWITEKGASNSSDWPGNRVAHSSGADLVELPNLAFQTGSLDSIRYDAKPAGITVADDGEVWFTEAEPGNPGYRIARANAAGPSGSYTEYPLPCVPPPASSCSGIVTSNPEGPVSIAAADDGSIWYTNVLRNAVGVLDKDRTTIKEYPLPSVAGGQPRQIRRAPDGTLWIAEFGFISHPTANAIIRIVPGATALDPPTADVFKTGAGKAPLGVAPDTKGNVWFTATADGSGGFIGRLAGVTGSEPAPPDPGTGGGGGGGGAPAPSPAPGGTVLTPGQTITAKVGDPTVHGTTASVDQICVGPPEARCSLVYIISAHEYVSGCTCANSSGKKKRKARLVVVGRKTVTLHGGQKKTVKIKLNARGRKILKRTGKLKATLNVSRKLGGGKTKRIKTKKLVFRKQ